VSARVALITGGARGIGLAIARRLAHDGCDLLLCGTRDEAALGDALASLRGPGREVAYVQADIGEAEGRERLVAAARARFGRLHVLVNNAGIAPAVRADVLEAGEESFDRVLRVNLKGPYFLTQLAARFLIEQRQRDPAFQGCVVFVTSISATTVSTNRGDYCLSKAGLAMAAQLWAVRLATHGIPVYEVRPGVVRTDMTAGVAERYDRLIADGLIPQARWGEPEDVARVVASLARGDAPYSTGAVITVDGGLTIPRL
jgi:3-oxoacyl-[acyl-carrier protein] reductase